MKDRHEMITEEEADIILVPEVSAMRLIMTVIIGNDTYIFILLLHFVYTSNIGAHVFSS